MSDITIRLIFILLFGILILLGSKSRTISTISVSSFWIFIILGLGTFLRFYKLDFDFPDSYHHDERWKVQSVMNMIDTGSLHPGYFFHPSLLLYLTFLSFKILSIFDLGLDLENVVRLSGRVVSALAGSFTIILLYSLVDYIWEKRGAIIAAFLLAVNPVHIACSRYLKEDALLVCFMIASLLAAYSFIKKQSLKNGILLGALIGLSIGSKYAGLLAAPLILIPILKSERKVIAATIFSCAAFFLLSTPYAILDFQLFIRGIMYEQRHIVVGNSIPVSAWSQLGLYQFLRGILPSFTLLGVALSLIGIGAWYKQKKEFYCIILVICCMWYFPGELVKSKIEPQPERYILPAIPLICFFVSIGLRSLESLSSKKAITFPLLMVLSGPAFFSTLEIPTDTRVIMKQYIERNIPNGSTFLLDHFFNTPQLDKSKWNVRYIKTRPLVRGYPEELNPKKLRERKISYVLLSSHTYQCLLYCKETPALVRRSVLRVFKKLSVVQQIRPKFHSFGFHNPVLTLFKVTESDQNNSLNEKMFLPNPFWPIPAPYDIERDISLEKE